MKPILEDYVKMTKAKGLPGDESIEIRPRVLAEKPLVFLIHYGGLWYFSPP